MKKRHNSDFSISQFIYLTEWREIKCPQVCLLQRITPTALFNFVCLYVSYWNCLYACFLYSCSYIKNLISTSVICNLNSLEGLYVSCTFHTDLPGVSVQSTRKKPQVLKRDSPVSSTHSFFVYWRNAKANVIEKESYCKNCFLSETGVLAPEVIPDWNGKSSFACSTRP